METVIDNVLNYDLSGIDIATLTRGKAVVRLYEDLIKFNNIIDAIGKTKQMIMLFPTQANPGKGHWIAVLYNDVTHTITHFDSYGLNIRQELGYSINGVVRENILGQLYKKAINDGYNVEFNTYPLQQLKNGINTCGRWCAVRCRFSYLNNIEFARLFQRQRMKPDVLITMLTFLTLKEDENDEEQILRELGGLIRR